jgi:hypothetical protein
MVDARAIVPATFDNRERTVRRRAIGESRPSRSTCGRTLAGQSKRRASWAEPRSDDVQAKLSGFWAPRCRLFDQRLQGDPAQDGDAAELFARGSRATKVVPSSRVEVTSIDPPCAMTIC